MLNPKNDGSLSKINATHADVATQTAELCEQKFILLWSEYRLQLWDASIQQHICTMLALPSGPLHQVLTLLQS